MSFNWWTSFSTNNVPVVAVPNAAWTTKCFNSENGFNVVQERGFVSTASGRDNFTISLTAKPIDGLGSVNITFQIAGLSTPSVQFQKEDGSNADGMTFDASNWNTPVSIFLKYLKDGETYFNVAAVGGGYDIPYVLSNNQNSPQTETKSSTLRVVTCANGQVGYGC